MTYNILNGDSLAYSFPEAGIAGEIIVCREALIDGNLSGDTLTEFWQNRAKSLDISLDEYQSYSVSEFEKILNAPDNSTFNLWFGYDLFCQANVWFVLSLIDSLAIRREVYIVYPTFLEEADIWKEFGRADAEDLRVSFSNKVQFGETDFQLARELWQAYKNQDLLTLVQLAERKSACFPYLKDACVAHIERFASGGALSRPERILKDILQKGETNFYKVFGEFSAREGVYGFGDSQLKPIYDKLMAQ
ncbi:DUF1835 domain-containing protein [Emticicia sp. BO119]|uniref:DUF1835 domain-containing protein n=1 Tax=Emticicia sp. BO119 TaxID=2757768 RepID=UPI0015F11BB0|nr:DUF1835 domain-containing protein [Emticicia sp. BO119]MBA4851808.1 DUF1835 domain-containing protein [Emticicia sp. BO119]